MNVFETPRHLSTPVYTLSSTAIVLKASRRKQDPEVDSIAWQCTSWL